MSLVKEKYRGTPVYMLVYGEMIIAARHCGTVTYQDLAQIMGLPLSGNKMGLEVGQILEEISDDEERDGRPMLSAVVVSTTGTPGDGFYALARRLGKTVGDATAEKRQFWLREKAAVYETWYRKLLPID